MQVAGMNAFEVLKAVLCVQRMSRAAELSARLAASFRAATTS